MTQDKTGGPAWKDATPYRQGERGRIDPSAWSITVHGVYVWVGKHIYNPDAFSLTCREIGIDAKAICSGDTRPDAAKNAALAFVSAALKQKADNLHRAADAMNAARNGGQDNG